MRKSHILVTALVGGTLLLSLAACGKKSGEMTFAHERFVLKLPKGVELNCKKLYNAGGCESYATGPMSTMDPDLADAQICDGGTASTSFYVVATKRPTQAFIPYPGRNPSPISANDMMLAWGKCKEARIGDTYSQNVDGSQATDFSLATPTGAGKARVFVSDDYSILAMAEPKSSGEKADEIVAFTSSLHPGPGPGSK